MAVFGRILFYAGCLAASVAQALEVGDIVRLNEPATLLVTGVRADTGAAVQGSGFCVDTRGLVLVTAHQAVGMKDLRGQLADGTSFALSVVEVDEAREAALLKAERPLPRAVVVGNAETLARGDPLVCIASPHSLSFSVVRGMVTGRPRLYRGMPVLQTDVPASPGSSGGPVFDRFGNAVGYIILYLEDQSWVVFANPVNNAYGLLRRHGVSIPDAALPEEGADAVLVPAAGTTERELRAVEAYNRGVAAADPAARVDAYETAVTLLPGFYEAWFNLGVARRAAGDLEGALAAYETAAKLRPEDARVFRNLGRIHLGLERYRDGAAAFERALELAPEAAQSYNDLGVAWQRLGRAAEAEAQFERALALDGSHAGAHYNLALALAGRGRAAEALEHFEAYLALRPDAADAAEVRALVAGLRK